MNSFRELHYLISFHDKSKAGGKNISVNVAKKINLVLEGKSWGSLKFSLILHLIVPYKLLLFCICIYLFATRLQLQKDAKKKNEGRNGEEA